MNKPESGDDSDITIIIDNGREGMPWWAIVVICAVAVIVVLVIIVVIKKCIMDKKESTPATIAEDKEKLVGRDGYAINP